MADWADVRRLALDLPETTEVNGGHDHLPAWQVRGKSFAWERPLRKRDIAELGDAAPTGPILGLRVADEGVKQALIAESPDCYFTTSHFEGYPAILVRLENIRPNELAEVLADAWVTRAPKRLAKEFLES